MKTKIPAILDIDDGEEIACACVSSHIPQTGVYKFLAKKTRDGKYQWAHFVQRDNGLKEKIFRGETDTREQLDEVLSIMNRNLKRTFGVEMHSADYDVYSLDGKKASPQIH